MMLFGAHLFLQTEKIRYICRSLYVCADMKKGLYCVISVLALLLSVSCSSTKYVPDGSYLLDEVSGLVCSRLSCMSIIGRVPTVLGG